MARGAITQAVVEVLGSFPGQARVSQHVIEVLLPTDTFSPTTPTGAGISQAVVEVLGSFPGPAHLSQHIVEVLMTETDPPFGGAPVPGAGVRVYGYAG